MQLTVYNTYITTPKKDTEHRHAHIFLINSETNQVVSACFCVKTHVVCHKKTLCFDNNCLQCITPKQHNGGETQRVAAPISETLSSRASRSVNTHQDKERLHELRGECVALQLVPQPPLQVVCSHQEIIQQNTDSFSCPSPLGMFSLAAAAVATTLPSPALTLYLFFTRSATSILVVSLLGGEKAGQSVYDGNEIGCREGHESG